MAGGSIKHTAGYSQDISKRAAVAITSLAVFLALALGFGGGGRGFPIHNLIVQLAAILLLALQPDLIRRFLRETPKGLLWLLAVTICVPLLQLVSLPPFLWTVMPGRESVEISLALIGQEQSWRPITVNSNLTLLSLLSLVPCLAVLIFAAAIPADRRWKVLILFAAVGSGVSLLLGGLQLVSGGQFQIYDGGNRHYLYASFANHNSSGLFFVLALCALLAMPFRRLKGTWWPIAGIAMACLLTVGVVLTQSRSSTLLLIVPLLALGLRLFGGRKGPATRRVLIALFGGSLLVAFGAMLLLQNAKIAQTADRFETTLEDRRPLIWADTVDATKRFWPVGSGAGTFDEVYQLDEALEHVSGRRAGRAHNDYLEIALENGITGILLIFAWCTYCAASLVKRRGLKDPLQIASAAALLSIALQSFVDYPLRNLAMLCVAAFYFSLLSVNTYSDGKESNIV
ncbi:O-antigen ligase family protein [Altericroceibacterium endophyticum]|uniref:O-antigen ligase-related domain-containing protein n=1 Tax=Altericroceibacterium endophyticum TaxID=1808508 RepID=A0A6I4TAY6_9SPHN|nr:O-antigen ligase family protein [Altericroceibacterium endophyticum]MXO67030.1 hypothetical protein [Altericroceibacterium endophyticum]